MEIELRFIRKRGRHLGSILFTTLTSVKRCPEVGVTCYNCNIMPLYHLKNFKNNKIEHNSSCNTVNLSQLHYFISYNASKPICMFELDSFLQHLTREGGGWGLLGVLDI